MKPVPLVRAIHLNVFLDVLRDVGAPVDRHLRDAALPATVEETPDDYLVVPRVLDCVMRAGDAEAAMELGFVAARRMTLDSLRTEFSNAVLTAPTCLERLRALVRHAPMEDGGLVSGIIDEGDNIRVYCDLHEFRASGAVAYSEWLQLQGIVEIVRSVAGAAWCPAEMTFVSGHAPSAAAREAFPGTRMLLRQQHTSVVVPRALMGAPCLPHAESEELEGGQELDVRSASVIREIVKPYLRDTPLTVAEVAALLGTSERSLQRHLRDLGLSFSRLVAEARYEVARELLSDRSHKIVDVAFAAGYEHPAHFSRAFRKMAGTSPQEFRRSLAMAG